MITPLLIQFPSPTPLIGSHNFSNHHLVSSSRIIIAYNDHALHHTVHHSFPLRLPLSLYENDAIERLSLLKRYAPVVNIVQRQILRIHNTISLPLNSHQKISVPFLCSILPPKNNVLGVTGGDGGWRRESNWKTEERRRKEEKESKSESERKKYESNTASLSPCINEQVKCWFCYSILITKNEK